MDRSERIFTSVLIGACLLGYASVLFPSISDIADWGSCILGIGLFLVIIVSGGQEEEECTNQS